MRTIKFLSAAVLLCASAGISMAGVATECNDRCVATLKKATGPGTREKEKAANIAARCCPDSCKDDVINAGRTKIAHRFASCADTNCDICGMSTKNTVVATCYSGETVTTEYKHLFHSTCVDKYSDDYAKDIYSDHGAKLIAWPDPKAKKSSEFFLYVLSSQKQRDVVAKWQAQLGGKTPVAKAAKAQAKKAKVAARVQKAKEATAAAAKTVSEPAK